MKETIDRRAAGAGTPVSEAGDARPPFVAVLLRRLAAVEQRMDALWDARGCLNQELWFALFQRRQRLSLLIWNRRAA